MKLSAVRGFSALQNLKCLPLQLRYESNAMLNTQFMLIVHSPAPKIYKKRTGSPVVSQLHETA
jgi:hypothetical protein